MTIPLDRIKHRFREQYNRDTKARDATIARIWNNTEAPTEDEKLTLTVMKMKGMGK